MTAVAPLTEPLKDASKINSNGGEIGGAQPGGAVVILPLTELSTSDVCPPGLEDFLRLDKFQMRHIPPCLPCVRGKIQFNILNQDDKLLLKSVQVRGDCFGGILKMAVGSLSDSLTVSAWREACCGNYCDKGLRVEAPPGNLLGYVTLKPDTECCDCSCSCGPCACPACTDCCAKCACLGCCADCCAMKTTPVMFIMNPAREVVMTINEDEPSCLESCCIDPAACLLECCCLGCICDLVKLCCFNKDFFYSVTIAVKLILRANNGSIIGNGEQIGSICKKYPGCLCPDPDHYILSVPGDLDVKMKTVVMCSIFFMKFLGW